MAENKIFKKITVSGLLKLESPAIIGSGNHDNADIEVICDSLTMKPIIPATSLGGVIRHYFNDNVVCDKSYFEKFFGAAKTQKGGMQSSFFLADLTSDDAKVSIRDGVKIDNEKGVALETGKYDYEIIERKSTFAFYLELNIKNEADEIPFKKYLATIIHLLENKRIFIGAKKNSGFGECKLFDTKIVEYDFSNSDDIIMWLNKTKKETTSLNEEHFKVNENVFEVNAWFALNGSMIIKTAPDDKDSTDSVHIKSNGKLTLPGTSIKGAVRSRAEKILNRIFGNKEYDSDEKNPVKKSINELFGYVDNDNRSDTAIASRVKIFEKLIDESCVKEQEQVRIKVDRFTGGTINTALFDEKPIWLKNNEKCINIIIKLKKPKDWEIGLILMILKDLWTSDIPIGGEKNIGRGRLSGKSVNIYYNETKYSIEDSDGKLIFKKADEENPTVIEELEKYSKELSYYSKELSKLEVV